MSIEGILEATSLRDHLYTRMRGARGENTAETNDQTASQDEVLVLLTEIRDSMRRLAEKTSTSSGGTTHE